METDPLVPRAGVSAHPPERSMCSCSQSSGSPSVIRATVNRSGTPVAVTTQYNSVNHCLLCSSYAESSVSQRSGHVRAPTPALEYQALLESVTAAPPNVVLKTYKRRWYILIIFSILALMQGGLCNVWTVIAESSEVAFGWSSDLVALMQLWLYISFLVFMFPASLLMDTKGLRVAMLVSAFAVVIGAGLRCITTNQPYVTWLAHTGQIFNGMASPVVYTAGPVISALWFPPNQRATATAITTVSGFAGNAICFLAGPNLVRQPIHVIDDNRKPADNATVAAIKEDILHLRYGECAICVLLFLAMLVYFPSRPPKPPSLSSAIVKVDFRHGFMDLFKRENANFWLMALPYGFIISIYSIWTGLFDVNLKNFNVGEQEAGWLGFYGVTAGCIAAVIVGRVVDVLVGKMKVLILIMNAGAVLSTFVFLLIAGGFIPFTELGLIICCVIQGIFCNGSIPLFYELAIESTYPVAEVATSAVLNILYNVLPIFFLLIFLVPNLTKEWMNWVMYASVLISFPMLLFFKEQYRRLSIDKKRMETDQDAEPEQVQQQPVTA